MSRQRSGDSWAAERQRADGQKPSVPDDAGLRPDALEKACRQNGARLLYLNPTIQNPTTRTMPAQRRHEIARTATTCGVKIIEDPTDFNVPAVASKTIRNAASAPLAET